MANGFMGKMLWVDLESGKLAEEKIDDGIAREYIGGYGLGARLLYEKMRPGVDPLGPENILGFVTGPLAGTPSTGGSRYTVVGKSPLTGGWGDANSGGVFGPYLKFAGFDAVFFTGISTKPVYLFIDEGKAQLKDAGHLWGKDSYETEDCIKEELGKEISVACIGPAGEKLAFISGIANDHGRIAARSGLGAVMGSKKLKALVVKGNLPIPMVDEEGAKELRKRTTLAADSGFLNKYGTCGGLVPAVVSGDSPVKNWAGISARDFPNPEKIGGDAILEKVQRKYACYRCKIACGGLLAEGAGDYKYPAGTKKPEYETVAMFGSNSLNDDLDSVIKCNDICNRMGLDTISTGGVIAFAIECYENGIITKEDTDGLEMTWGNHKSIVAMTEKLANREGFGDVLADGVRVAAERIGKGSEEYAMHIRGQEFGAHDPKYRFNWALAYKADATPGRHSQGPAHDVPGLPAPDSGTTQENMQPGYMLKTNWQHVIQSLGMCKIVYGCLPDIDAQMNAIKTVTGWDVTFDELFRTGERIANIRHLFCLREGVNILQQNYPDRIAGRPPKEDGGLKGITIDEELLFNDFLKAMDWDPETAMPSKSKLEELGLQDLFERYGQIRESGDVIQ